MLTGNLIVRPISAQFQHKKELFDKADPYCRVTIGSQVEKTDVSKNQSTNPSWSNQFTFQNVSISSILRFDIYDKNVLLDTSLGSAEVALNNLSQINNRFNGWIQLFHHNSVIGSLLIELEFFPSQMPSKMQETGYQATYQPVYSTVSPVGGEGISGGYSGQQQGFSQGQQQGFSQGQQQQGFSQGQQGFQPSSGGGNLGSNEPFNLGGGYQQGTSGGYGSGGQGYGDVSSGGYGGTLGSGGMGGGLSSGLSSGGLSSGYSQGVGQTMSSHQPGHQGIGQTVGQKISQAGQSLGQGIGGLGQHGTSGTTGQQYGSGYSQYKQ